MLKNYLLSPLCSASARHLSLFQPSFSFSFNASFFFSSLLVSTPLFLFCFPVPFFFLVSVLPFLLQRPSLFSSPPFSFLQVCCPLFSAQNTFFSPNVFQPKRFFTSATLLFFFFLLYSFLVQPSFFFISVSGLLFFLFFSSIYPSPNVLSSCFTSLLFE